MRRSNSKKVARTYIPASSRTETGEQIIKLGSIPLETLKQSDAYKNRIEVKDSWVKRKYACCFAYFGTNYQGLQMNPGCKSVEAELERALFLSGCFYEDNYGFLQKLQWTRAARTDRGVHALGQCCSMRLFVPSDVNEKEIMISNINSFLPPDIKCMALTKVTKTFNAHTGCSSRIYSYILPTYLFTDMSQMNEWLLTAYQKQGPIIDCARIGGYVEPGSDKYLGYEALKELRLKCDSLTSFRCGPDKLQLFRQCLQFFEGTKSYHNFTTGKEAGEDSSKRYITSVTSSDPFLLSAEGTILPSSLSSSSSTSSSSSSSIDSRNDNDTQVYSPIEWVCVTIMGQSFVLNQIRKMMGLAIDITRGVTSFDTMHALVDIKCRMEVAMAPALGLYVNELFFTSYNSKQAKDRERKVSDMSIAKNRAEYRAKATGKGNNNINGHKPSVEQIKAHALAAVQRALLGTIDSSSNSNTSSSSGNSNNSSSSSGSSTSVNIKVVTDNKRKVDDDDVNSLDTPSAVDSTITTANAEVVMIDDVTNLNATKKVRLSSSVEAEGDDTDTPITQKGKEKEVVMIRGDDFYPVQSNDTVLVDTTAAVTVTNDNTTAAEVANDDTTTSAVVVTTTTTSTDGSPILTESTFMRATETTNDADVDEELVAAEEGGEDDEKGDTNLGGELIEWWTEEPTKTRIEEFRTLQLWPHIVQQEAEGLSFLFYLDSLRLKTRSLYKGKLIGGNANINNNSNNSSSNSSNNSTKKNYNHNNNSNNMNSNNHNRDKQHQK